MLSHDKVNVWTLPDLVNFVESKETVKFSMAILGGYEMTARVDRQEKKFPFPKENPKEKPQEEMCLTSGRRKHEGKQCIAVDRDCFNCGKKGHLSAVCKMPKKEKKAKAVEVTGETTEEEKVESVGEVGHWLCGCVKELKENISMGKETIKEETMEEEMTKDPRKEGQSKVRKGYDCKCPDREMPPELPTEIPFPATEENREKLGVLDQGEVQVVCIQRV